MIQELNPAKLALLFRRQLELCNVKKGETIAAVSDLATRREYLQAAFAAADDLGADIYELCVNSLPSWTKVGVPTIGKAKGTLEAVKAADLVVIFHVPLFTKWLKQVMDGGTRVLMIIDAPDDLEQLMSPNGLKDACKYAESIYQENKARSRAERSGYGSNLRVRRIPGHDAVGLRRRARAFRSLGRRAHPYLSERRAARTAPWCSSPATS